MRHWFGQGSSDFTVVAGSGNTLVLSPSTTVTLWSAPSGGTQYTDLLDSAGGAITQVVSGDGVSLPAGLLPRFQGPDNIVDMWADAGAGSRFAIRPTDLGVTVNGKVDVAGGHMTGPLVLADDSPAASQDYVASRAGGAPSVLVWSMTGILSARTGTDRIYNDTGRNLTIGTVRASASTGPVGQALIVDVNKGGSTIYATQANRPTIPDGGNTGTGGTPDTPTWSPGEWITVDIDQVGTTTPGSSLTVTVVAT